MISALVESHAGAYLEGGGAAGAAPPQSPIAQEIFALFK